MNGSIFMEFTDSIDIAISRDPVIESMLMEKAKDVEDGVFGSSITEAANEVKFDTLTSILSGFDSDTRAEDIPAASSINHYDMMADAFINAYQDIMHGVSMDTGTMIDIIAES